MILKQIIPFACFAALTLTETLRGGSVIDARVRNYDSGKPFRLQRLRHCEAIGIKLIK